MALTMKKQGPRSLSFFISKSVPAAALLDSGNNSSSIGESGRLEVTSITSVVFVLKNNLVN